ncbi:MAG: ABC transporter permease [Bacteroidales bacterium]|nr:ABC transporter permease [Bacteroidales bacterium]
MRNLFIYKRFAFINVIGLSIGITVSLLILLYVRYEASFDSFNPNANHICRIVTKSIQDGSVGASTPLALSDVLKKDYPEIDKTVALLRTSDVLKANKERYNDLNGAIVEKEFFKIFNLPLVSGNQNAIFTNPFEAVITENLADILYGDVDPIGKTFEYENQIFTVSGIIRTIPSNSIFQDLDYFLSDEFRYKSYPDLSERWYHFGLFTFITFKGNTLPVGFEQKLSNIEKQYYPDFMKNRNQYLVTPFKGSHLNPSLENDLSPAVAPVYLWLLSAIAIGILAIACLNFINISIANAGKRNIETGIKKVHGAASHSLIGEVFAEMAIIVVISLFLSFIGMNLLLPSFNRLIEKNVVFSLSDPLFWIGIVGIGVITTLFSGLYPAVIFSRPSPVKVLLQRRGSVQNKMTFQRGFVVLQFMVTVILAITLLFIVKQTFFMQNYDTGFEKKNLIAIPVRSLGDNSYERLNNTNIFVQTLEKYKAQYGFGKSSVTEFVPGFGFRNLFKIYSEEGAYSDGLELLSCDIDENFPKVFGLRMLDGRFFSKSHATDVDALVINESAYKKLGWKSLDGKWVGLFSKENRKEVIGVIKDINVTSLHNPIGPMIYQFGPHHMYPGYVTLRLNPDKKAASVDFIKAQWMRLFPDIPFEFESIDVKYRAAYGEEAKLVRIIGVFSVIAMLLSLLGILALSTLECEQRTKEIGIRRVIGADISGLLAMLNKSFIKWVALAFTAACPIAWYTMHKWLENFAYKTELSWWVFAAAGAVAVTVALITVSWQSWRAATRNPVEALRYE